jgi:hypothetical protein
MKIILERDDGTTLDITDDSIAAITAVLNELRRQLSPILKFIPTTEKDSSDA